MPAAVIFDNDGLTLDTEGVWTRAERLLFARYGREFTMEHKRDMLGTSMETASRKLEGHLGQPGRAAELIAELHEIVMGELDHGAEPMAGARELLRALRGAGVPIGLASNSTGAFVARALGGSGLADCFDVVVTAEEVARPKPAPDVYLAAAAGLGAAPADCVALEDSKTGLTAARAAGMTVIGVPSFPGVELSGADLVAPSLADARVWELLGLERPVP
jgi:HAD superfamily hydrolase (TIGR01509 family)